MVWVVVIGVLSFTLYFFISYIEQQGNEKPDIVEEVISENNIEVSKRFDFISSSATILDDEKNKNIWYIRFDENKCIPYSDILEVLFCEGIDVTKEAKVAGIYGDGEESYVNQKTWSNDAKGIDIELHIKDHESEFDFQFDIINFSPAIFNEHIKKSSYLYRDSYSKAIECYQLFEAIVNKNDKIRKIKSYGQR